MPLSKSKYMYMATLGEGPGPSLEGSVQFTARRAAAMPAVNYFTIIMLAQYSAILVF